MRQDTVRLKCYRRHKADSTFWNKANMVSFADVLGIISAVNIQREKIAYVKENTNCAAA